MQAGRQRRIHVDRDAGRDSGRQRQRCMQAGRDRDVGRQTDSDRCRQTEVEADRDRDVGRQAGRDRDVGRQAGKQRQRRRQTQMLAGRQTERARKKRHTHLIGTDSEHSTVSLPTNRFLFQNCIGFSKTNTKTSI